MIKTLNYNSLIKQIDGNYLLSLSHQTEIDKLLQYNYFKYDKYYKLNIKQNYNYNLTKNMSDLTFYITSPETYVELTVEQISDWIKPFNKNLELDLTTLNILSPTKIGICSKTKNIKVKFSDYNSAYWFLYNSGKYFQNDFINTPLYIRYCPTCYENDYKTLLYSYQNNSNDIKTLEMLIKKWRHKNFINLHLLAKVKDNMELAQFQKPFNLCVIKNQKTLLLKSYNYLLTKFPNLVKLQVKEFIKLNTNKSPNLYTVWNKRNQILKEADKVSKKTIEKTLKISVDNLVPIVKSKSLLRKPPQKYPKVHLNKTSSPESKFESESTFNFATTNDSHNNFDTDTNSNLNSVFTLTNNENDNNEIEHEREFINELQSTNEDHFLEKGKNIKLKSVKIKSYLNDILIPSVISRIEKTNQNLPQQFHFTKSDPMYVTEAIYIEKQANYKPKKVINASKQNLQNIKKNKNK